MTEMPPTGRLARPVPCDFAVIGLTIEDRQEPGLLIQSANGTFVFHVGRDVATQLGQLLIEADRQMNTGLVTPPAAGGLIVPGRN